MNFQNTEIKKKKKNHGAHNEGIITNIEELIDCVRHKLFRVKSKTYYKRI